MNRNLKKKVVGHLRYKSMKFYLDWSDSFSCLKRLFSSLIFSTNSSNSIFICCFAVFASFLISSFLTSISFNLIECKEKFEFGVSEVFISKQLYCQCLSYKMFCLEFEYNYLSINNVLSSIRDFDSLLCFSISSFWKFIAFSLFATTFSFSSSISFNL